MGSDESENDAERHSDNKVKGPMTISPNVKKAAWFVVYVIWMILDVDGLWDHHRTICIAVGTFGTCVLAFAEFDHIKPASICSGIAVIVGLIVFLVAGTPSVPAGEVLRQIPDSEVVGTLKAGSIPTSSDDPCNGTVGPGALTVLIGDNAVANDFGPVAPLEVGTCKPIVVNRGADGLTIDTSLYDDDGNLIGTIVGNNFQAMSGGAHSVSREGNYNTLAIKDAKGRELVYVKYLNPNVVLVRGNFGCAGHRPVQIRDGQPVPGFLMSKSCLANAPVGIGVP